ADRNRSAWAAAARRRGPTQPQAAQLRRAAAPLADREDLSRRRNLDLGRRGIVILADRQAANFADDLDRLPHERRFQIGAILLRQSGHGGSADGDSEVLGRPEVALAVEIE